MHFHVNKPKSHWTFLAPNHKINPKCLERIIIFLIFATITRSRLLALGKMSMLFCPRLTAGLVHKKGNLKFSVREYNYK